jgi:hypothetical protein
MARLSEQNMLLPYEIPKCVNPAVSTLMPYKWTNQTRDKYWLSASFNFRRA